MTHEKPTCFVISPIGESKSEIRERADFALEKVIAPVFRGKYNVVRADKLARPGIISKEIIQHVMGAPMVVADLTGCNANVFYELALRHQTGLPFIQIAEQGTVLPFDVSPLNVVFYDLSNPIALEKETRKEMRKQLKFIEDSGASLRIDSPVTIALGSAGAGKAQPAYRWEDILPMVNSLHRRIALTYNADVILTMSGPGGITALLMHSVDNRNTPVIYATTFPQSQTTRDAFERTAVEAGYRLVETEKWRVYLPPLLTSLPSGSRVLIVDDRVVSGATHRAAKSHLEGLGLECRCAALVAASAAHQPDWYMAISDSSFQFPWGSNEGRG
ncbi:MAG TPA: phosphoribosyltransferase family protein [Solirubrobacteraceae bacterium]|jgi:hypoxanthine phosphoribosyltransferase